MDTHELTSHQIMAQIMDTHRIMDTHELTSHQIMDTHELTNHQIMDTHELRQTRTRSPGAREPRA